MNAFENPAKKVILVVDDDQTVIDFYQMVLTHAGFEMAAAEDGKAAIHYLKGGAGRQVRLIITDLMMPHMGGYDILKELQAEPFKNIPVFVSSAKALTPDTLAMIRVEPNVREFLPKPIDPDELISKVRAALKTPNSR